jgi:hypothetical protein
MKATSSDSDLMRNVALKRIDVLAHDGFGKIRLSATKSIDDRSMLH